MEATPNDNKGTSDNRTRKKKQKMQCRFNEQPIKKRAPTIVSSAL